MPGYIDGWSLENLAKRFERFGREECVGFNLVYEPISLGVANDPAVLVESAHREQVSRFDKVLTKEQIAILYDFTGNPEKVTFENFQESQAQVRTAIKFPAIPLIVLTKGLPTPKPSNWSASLGDPFPQRQAAYRGKKRPLYS